MREKDRIRLGVGQAVDRAVKARHLGRHEERPIRRHLHEVTVMQRQQLYLLQVGAENVGGCHHVLQGGAPRQADGQVRKRGWIFDEEPELLRRGLGEVRGFDRRGGCRITVGEHQHPGASRRGLQCLAGQVEADPLDSLNARYDPEEVIVRPAGEKQRGR